MGYHRIHCANNGIQRSYYHSLQTVKDSLQNLSYTLPGAIPVACENASNKLSHSVQHHLHRIPDIL